MRLKLYQAQVLAGVLLAALMEGLSMTTNPSLSKGVAESVQAAVFLFCCVGVITGGRELRSAFDTFGGNKNVAKRDPVYTRMRAQLQITSVAAVAAIGLVAARRFGVADVVPLATAVALGFCLPIVNRLTGWAENTPPAEK